MKPYCSPGACSLSPHIALREVSLAPANGTRERYALQAAMKAEGLVK